MHPAGPDRTGKLGELVYTGCPALEVSPFTKHIYELYHIMHRGPNRTPLFDGKTVWKWPAIIPLAFNVIEYELNAIAAEPRDNA